MNRILAGLASLAPLIALAQDLPPVNPSIQAALADSLARDLREVYIFEDKAEAMAQMLEASASAGAWAEQDDPHLFVEALTRDLREICADLHLRVGVQPLPQGDEPQGPMGPDPLEQARRSNFGFQHLERLEGNVGYLELSGFSGFPEAGEVAVASMNWLAGCDALIIDLRANGGGSPSMIQLISSYLFEGPRHLNSFYIRQSDTTQQFWTQNRVQGRRLTEQPVYVLTSRRTFSAAEEFSYNLKHMERATLVGETTGGGAHPVTGYFYDFEHWRFTLSMPYGRAINPVTGTNWEGVGVVPQVECPSEQALQVAHRKALEDLLAAGKNEDRDGIQWALDGLRAQSDPLEISRKLAKELEGDYGPRHITRRKGDLYYQRDERPEFRLIGIREDYFALEGMDTFRLQVERDGEGRISALVGIYAGGNRDRSPRDP